LKALGKHFGFMLHLGDIRFKDWLDRNALVCLKEIGIQLGQTVVDIGCGSGTFTISSATLVGESGIVYALDVDDRALNKLRIRAEKEGLKNIEILHSSANDSIKLSDKSVDHVLLLDVLQEISNKNRLFEEVRRVLRFGGTVTVFPMHLDYSQIIKLAEAKDLRLQSRKFDDHVLVFIKNTLACE
jgi:ubiquinone/menaquinone biosynthesis C-methylase UbiE